MNQLKKIIALQAEVIRLQNLLLEKGSTAPQDIKAYTSTGRELIGKRKNGCLYEGWVYRTYIINASTNCAGKEFKERVAREYDMAEAMKLPIHTNTVAAQKHIGVDNESLYKYYRANNILSITYLTSLARGLFYNPEVLEELKNSAKPNHEVNRPNPLYRIY